MNFNSLFKLISQGEGAQLDFKMGLSDKDASSKMSKLMAAFANTEGGTILFGVADDGEVVGLTSARTEEVERLLAGWAHNSCKPALNPQFEKTVVGDDKTVLCVTIARQQGQICLVNERCYIRKGSNVEVVQFGGEIGAVQSRLQGGPADAGREAQDIPTQQFTPVAPPRAKGFKGRQEQMNCLFDCLDNKDISIVVIEGISGIGKSALASQFALSVGERDYKYCWMPCHPETTFDALSFEMSSFARSHGDDEPADLLEDTKGRFEDRVSRIASALARYRYALFFDDYHLASDPKVDALLRGIEERSGLTKVFLTARRRPRLASQVRPLGMKQVRLHEGLDPESCAQLLSDCGLTSLDKQTAHRIWELSGKGHPKALQLFAGRARSVPIEELLSTLPVFRDDLKELWLKPLLEELPIEQQDVVSDLSVFDRPLPSGCLPQLYPEKSPDDLEQIRRGLLERFILDFVNGGCLQMHPLIRDYCYDSRPANRQELHHWAGFFYQRLAFNSDDVNEDGTEDGTEAVTDLQVENGIAAWSHYVRAGDHEQATRVVGQIRAPLLNSGQYDRILFLLEGTKPSSELKQDFFAIDKARIKSLQGDKDEAVALLEPLVESHSAELAREAVLVLATVYIEHGMADEAVELLQFNWQRCTVGASSRVLSRFLRRMVEAYLLKNDAKSALSWAKQMLAGCEVRDDKRGGAIALRQMAASLQAQKDLNTALSLSQSSFEILEEQGIAREAAASRLQSAFILRDLKQLEPALEAFEDALRRFSQMRDRENCVLCRQSITMLRSQMDASALHAALPVTSCARPAAFGSLS